MSEMLKLTGATSTGGGAGMTVTASPTSEFSGDSAAVVVVVLAGVVVGGADVGGAAGVDRGATVTGATAIVSPAATGSSRDSRPPRAIAAAPHTTAAATAATAAAKARRERVVADIAGRPRRPGQFVRRRATSSPAPLRPRRPAAMASATTVPDVPAGTSLSPVLTRVGAPPRPSMVWV